MEQEKVFAKKITAFLDESEISSNISIRLEKARLNALKAKVKKKESFIEKFSTYMANSFSMQFAGKITFACMLLAVFVTWQNGGLEDYAQNETVIRKVVADYTFQADQDDLDLLDDEEFI